MDEKWNGFVLDWLMCSNAHVATSFEAVDEEGEDLIMKCKRCGREVKIKKDEVVV